MPSIMTQPCVESQLSFQTSYYKDCGLPANVFAIEIVLEIYSLSGFILFGRRLVSAVVGKKMIWAYSQMGTYQFIYQGLHLEIVSNFSLQIDGNKNI